MAQPRTGIDLPVTETSGRECEACGHDDQIRTNPTLTSLLKLFGRAPRPRCNYTDGMDYSGWGVDHCDCRHAFHSS